MRIDPALVPGPPSVAVRLASLIAGFAGLAGLRSAVPNFTLITFTILLITSIISINIQTCRGGSFDLYIVTTALLHFLTTGLADISIRVSESFVALGGKKRKFQEQEEKGRHRDSLASLQASKVIPNVEVRCEDWIRWELE